MSEEKQAVDEIIALESSWLFFWRRKRHFDRMLEECFDCPEAGLWRYWSDELEQECEAIEKELGYKPQV